MRNFQEPVFHLFCKVLYIMQKTEAATVPSAFPFREVESNVSKHWTENAIVNKAKEKVKNGKRHYFLDGPPYTSGTYINIYKCEQYARTSLRSIMMTLLYCRKSAHRYSVEQIA